jgi:Dyp-type peroxidase family
MENLDKHDLQGLIARGYGQLPYALFLLLRVKDVKHARAFLRTARITNATRAPDATALNVAFTRQGLDNLGVPSSAVDSFSREFKDGMDYDTRAKALGDSGANAPANWSWGHATKPDVLLMLYARYEHDFAPFANAIRDAIASGFEVLAEKSTSAQHLKEQKEHFGWRDGISTPIVAELGGKEPAKSWTTPFPLGEFVIGYKNEYGSYTESPTVNLTDDPHDLLPLTRDKTHKDLGHNGTYLVYREMKQEVAKLWSYLAEHSREPGADPVASAVALGSKMVGRWPGGAPLRTSTADVAARSKQNDFTYYAGHNPVTNRDEGDRFGIACPVGAHIRRSNPRDDLPTDHGDKNSIEMVRKHQMIRRGRPFGAPLAPNMTAEEFFARRDQPDTELRGLHFICLVGHIGRQFEFVQRTWLSSPVFGALFKDADPLVAVHRTQDDDHGNASDEFTCPAEPVRRKYKGLPQFTQLLGGAYFFMPSMRALRFIAGSP